MTVAKYYDTVAAQWRAINPGPVGLVWQGVWASTTAYLAMDAVSYNGSSYLCILDRTATATTPNADATHWVLLAQRGTDGSGAVSSVNGILPDGAGDVALTPADVSAVPTTRTVNGKALSADVTLAAADVTAIPDPASKNVGDMPQWDGTAWVAAPAPTSGGASLSTVFLMMGA